MTTDNHYDVIIIGSGAGGGTLAHRLAPSGKRVLILERGPYVTRERENWDTKAVNVEGRYQTKEEWRDRHGKQLHPHTNYYVGGNTKFYGAALFRMRKEDFGELAHHGVRLDGGFAHFVHGGRQRHIGLGAGTSLVHSGCVNCEKTVFSDSASVGWEKVASRSAV